MFISEVLALLETTFIHEVIYIVAFGSFLIGYGITLDSPILNVWAEGGLGVLWICSLGEATVNADKGKTSRTATSASSTLVFSMNFTVFKSWLLL